MNQIGLPYYIQKASGRVLAWEDAIAKTMGKAEKWKNEMKAYVVQKYIVICIPVTIFHIFYGLIPEIDFGNILIGMYMKRQKKLFILRLMQS